MENQPKKVKIKKDGIVVFESSYGTVSANKPYHNEINVEVSEDVETCYMSGRFLDNLVNIIDRILPYNQRLWKRKMKRVNKRNR